MHTEIATQHPQNDNTQSLIQTPPKQLAETMFLVLI